MTKATEATPDAHLETASKTRSPSFAHFPRLAGLGISRAFTSYQSNSLSMHGSCPTLVRSCAGPAWSSPWAFLSTPVAI